MQKNNIVTEKKTKICEAMIECLKTKSYHETTIKDIAQACGLPTGSIYYYYTSKEDILLDAYHLAYDWETDAMEQRLTAFTDQGDFSAPLSILTPLMEHICSIYEDNRMQQNSVYLTFLVTSNSISSLRPLIHQLEERYFCVLRNYLTPYIKSSAHLEEFIRFYYSLTSGLDVDQSISLSIETGHQILHTFLQFALTHYFDTDKIR